MASSNPGCDRGSTGMMLGKFLPPHSGHLYLADFARSFVDELTVLVCSIEAEPIPGALRFAWMRELLPDSNVVHHTAELPQSPEDHADFWALWRDSIRDFVPDGPDFVFASEQYGQKLADILDARFVPVDIERTVVPTNGTAIRANPFEHWQYLPAPVRAHYVKRVCIFGPESTGKTTLARDLAKHFKTTWTPEWARPWLNLKGGRCDPDDIPIIARGQIASEEAAARCANHVLFCDTDVLTTTIWSDTLFCDCPDWVRSAAESRVYDLYLLLDVDVPWVNDQQRFLASQRTEFLDICRTSLESRGRPYVHISGNWSERLAKAIRAVEAMLSQSC